MIKILETESSLGWGGQENRTARLINHLDSTRFRVYVATPKDSELYKRRQEIRAEFFPVEMRKSYSLKAIWQLYKIIKKERIDIVSTHSGKDAWLGVIAARLAGVKAIRTRHLQTPISSPLSYNLHDKVVCVSDFVKEDLAKRGVQKGRLCTIHTGVDVSKYAPHREGILRRELGLREEEILVGIVAVLRGAKGHKLLLEAFAKLSSPMARLVIIGDGPQRENIALIVEQLNLQERVVMLGHREDVAKIMPDLDIFVLPSSMEALGTAILEASACGVAVLGSNVGGIPECVRENGQLFEAGDSDSLVKNLQALINDTSKRKERGAKGRVLVEEEFSVEAMVRKTEGLYREIITPQKILIVSNTALGDTILSTPLFRETRLSLPKAHIAALLNPVNAMLFETNPYLDKIELYGGRWRGFLGAWWKLWRRGFDVALLGHSNDPQITPLCLLLGISKIIKIPNHKNPWQRFHHNPPVSPIEDQYAVLTRLLTLKYIGIESSNTRLELFLKEEWTTEAKEILRPFGQKKLIGIQMGASNRSRQWFVERWIELAKRIIERDEEVVIVFVGSKNELEEISLVAQALPQDRVFISAGRLSLGAAAALIGELGLLFTPDTGPLHIAVALRVKTISLFAVANPKNSLPDYDQSLHRYIKVDRCCEPCVGKRCAYQKCMEAIGVDEVYEEYKKLQE